ncbi:MAG: hypothetical protein K1000chlam3_00551 [Chlamydiae bacterium]|nr:hypothetical protein [Chlamydiota bacterium]
MGLPLTASQEVLLRETKQLLTDQKYHQVIESADKALERIVIHIPIQELVFDSVGYSSGFSSIPRSVSMNTAACHI